MNNDSQKLDRLEKAISEIVQYMATKDDLKRFSTKDDLKKFATKEDLKDLATKDDLKGFATKDDLKRELAALKKELIEHTDTVFGDLLETVEKNKADKSEVTALKQRVD